MVGLLYRKSYLSRIAAGVLICWMAVSVNFTTGSCAPASTKSKQNLSAREKKKLMRKAVTHYKKKEIAEAREALEQAQIEFPENYAVPYYLGLIYLEQGNRAKAIAQWQRYVKMAPQNETVMKIQKNITLLLREQAREFAKQAVAQEAALSGGRADDNAIAVTSFNNLGSENLGPVGKGMTAMLITDLSRVPDLRVVERIKLHALLEEMKLGTSGLVDAKTAPRVGKLLKAKNITSGSLADLAKERMMIASALMDTEKKASIGTQEAKGQLKQFYELEKQIACQIIEDLGKDCNAVPPDFNKIHTQSMPALVLYSRGLDYFDEENYDQAREMFQKAMDEDPHFDLAAAALIATPTAAMMTLSTSEMISTASASGPSPAASQSAVASASTADKAVAATASSSATGSAGLSPLTMALGGAAIAGGGLAMAGGGGGGDDNVPPAAINLSGEWRGTWTNADNSIGEVIFSLTQTGSDIQGSASVTGSNCLSTGAISGTVSSNSANLTIHSGSGDVVLNATADDTAGTLNGTWNFSDSSASQCAGETGSFTITLTSGAVVHW